MKKLSLIVLFVVLVTVASIAKEFGPSELERSLVMDYLQTTDTYRNEMDSLVSRMEKELTGLQADFERGSAASKEAQNKISEFSAQMNAVRKKIQKLAPPPEAVRHRELCLEKVKTTIEILNPTSWMVELYPILRTEDPGQTKYFMTELRESGPKDARCQFGIHANNRGQALLAQVAELEKRGREFETEARKERKRLIEKFDLEFPDLQELP